MADLFDEEQKKYRDVFGKASSLGERMGGSIAAIPIKGPTKLFPEPKAMLGIGDTRSVYGPPGQGTEFVNPLRGVGEWGTGPTPAPGIPSMSPEQLRANVAMNAEERDQAARAAAFAGETPAGGLPSTPMMGDWTKTVNREGGATYELAGGQGTLTTEGWNPRGGGTFSTAPGAGVPLTGIPKTAEQLELAAREAGTYQGRTLAEKEKEMYGGIEPPGEFNYDKFKEGVSKLGVTITPQVMTKLYSDAIQRHESRIKDFNDMVTARMQFGEGSPQMITARSNAFYHNQAAQIAAMKAPAEIMKSWSEAQKIKAEAAGIPAQTRQSEALTKRYEALAKTESFQPYITQYKKMMDYANNEINPDIKAQQVKGINEWFGNLVGQFMSQQESGSAQLKALHPTWNIPDNPVHGQVYELEPGKSARWDANLGRYVKA